MYCVHCIAFSRIIFTFSTKNMSGGIVLAVGCTNMRIPLHIAQQLWRCGSGCSCIAATVAVAWLEVDAVIAAVAVVAGVEGAAVVAVVAVAVVAVSAIYDDPRNDKL